jgi:hypothetical protein
VVVTVVAMHMVEAPEEDKIKVVAVRDDHRTVSGVRRRVGARHRFTAVGVCDADFQSVLVHMGAVVVMKVAIVKKIHMCPVLNTFMSAIRRMGVGMVGMFGAFHGRLLVRRLIYR